MRNRRRENTTVDSENEFGHVEVDQQPEREVPVAEVAHKLREVCVVNGLDGFQFDDHQVFNNQIEAKIGKLNPFVEAAEGLLARGDQSGQLKLVRHRSFVHVLKQPRTENGVDLDRAPDDAFGDPVPSLRNFGLIGVPCIRHQITL